MLPVPNPPSDLESFAHELTHTPTEPWCEFCQLGKGQDTPHRCRSADKRERGPSEVQLDYIFLDSAWRTCASADAWITILTMVDDDISVPLALALPTKSPSFEYTVASAVDFLKRLGHTAIILQSDGEPSARALCDKILTQRLPLRTMVQHTPPLALVLLARWGDPKAP